MGERVLVCVSQLGHRLAGRLPATRGARDAGAGGGDAEAGEWSARDAAVPAANIGDRPAGAGLPAAHTSRSHDAAAGAACAEGRGFTAAESSGQDENPGASGPEVVRLEQAGDPRVDATVPAIMHKVATPVDFAARSVAVARGAVQVAAGKQGIRRIEMPALSVLSHTPLVAEHQVKTNLDKISIEFSGVIEEHADLRRYVRVQTLDPQVGEDVTVNFDVGFALRKGLPSRRFIELTPRAGGLIDAGEHYIVTARRG